jgi:hypothetical protein
LTRPPSGRASARPHDSFARMDVRALGGRLKWPAMTNESMTKRKR